MDRQYRWAGAALERGGDRIAVVRGNVIVPLAQKKPPFWRHNRSLNQLLMSSFHLTPDNLVSYFDALREFKPAVIDGYPSSLYVLAKVLLNRRRNAAAQGGDHLVRNAVRFPARGDRSRVPVHACSTITRAAERVVFAAECDHHQGHHLCEEYGVTEVLGDDGSAARARPRRHHGRHLAAQPRHADDPVPHHRPHGASRRRPAAADGRCRSWKT